MNAPLEIDILREQSDALSTKDGELTAESGKVEKNSADGR